jgi:hypothetical protein
MCGHSRTAGAVTHTGPIGNFLFCNSPAGLAVTGSMSSWVNVRTYANQTFLGFVSVHEAAHADVHHDPERQERKHH